MLGFDRTNFIIIFIINIIIVVVVVVNITSNVFLWMHISQMQSKSSKSFTVIPVKDWTNISSVIHILIKILLKCVQDTKKTTLTL